MKTVNFQDETKVCYLDNAKEAILSPGVQYAGLSALKISPWKWSSTSLKDDVRHHFASLIGASPDDIAIMASTAFAITLAATNIARLKKSGGTIVVLQDEMCSQIYPWQQAIHENSTLKFDIVPFSDDFSQGILDRLNESVVAVSIPNVHWSSGSLINLSTISTRCRELNIDLILDGTQSIGILPTNVASLEPALMTCSIQKWLRAPPGMALVYVNPKLQNLWDPLDQHGRNRDFEMQNWNAYPNQMTSQGYPEKFFSNARKFDSGGTFSNVMLYMTLKSLKEVISLDLSEAQITLQQIMLPLLKWATENKIWYPSNHAYHLVGLKPNNLSVEAMLEVSECLASQGIYISVRNGFFRISPYINNTKEDIVRLINAFESCLSLCTAECILSEN
jgi:selenocysteine lyase/cysteine desulfurase